MNYREVQWRIAVKVTFYLYNQTNDLKLKLKTRNIKELNKQLGLELSCEMEYMEREVYPDGYVEWQYLLHELVSNSMLEQPKNVFIEDILC